VGLENVAVQWPRTGQFYEPVSASEFADFADFAMSAPPTAGPAAALASHIAKHGQVHASAYSNLVDLLLGLDGVLYATDAAAEDEDPVIDPDGCAWIAGGLETFVSGHSDIGDEVTFDSVAEVLRRALTGARLADQQLRWLQGRIDALRDADGHPPQWTFTLLELSVLAAFYRRCTDRSFAVYADF
jgi:hypothetical protein